MTEGWDGLAPAENEQPQADKLDIVYAKAFSSRKGGRCWSIYARSLLSSQAGSRVKMQVLGTPARVCAIL